MALAEYGNAFNIDTDGSGNPILVDAQSGDVIAIYDRGSGSWQVTEIQAATGDFDSVNTGQTNITNRGDVESTPETARWIYSKENLSSIASDEQLRIRFTHSTDSRYIRLKPSIVGGIEPAERGVLIKEFAFRNQKDLFGLSDAVIHSSGYTSSDFSITNVDSDTFDLVFSNSTGTTISGWTLDVFVQRTTENVTVSDAVVETA